MYSLFTNEAYFRDGEKLATLAQLSTTHASSVLANRNVTGPALRKVLALSDLTVRAIDDGVYPALVMFGRGAEDQKQIITTAAARSPKAAALFADAARPDVLVWLHQAAHGENPFRGARATFAAIRPYDRTLHVQSDQPGYLQTRQDLGRQNTVAHRAKAAQTYEQLSALTETLAETTVDLELAEQILLTTVEVPEVVDLWSREGGMLGGVVAALDPRHPAGLDTLTGFDLPRALHVALTERLGDPDVAVEAALADLRGAFVQALGTHVDPAVGKWDDFWDDSEERLRSVHRARERQDCLQRYLTGSELTWDDLGPWLDTDLLCAQSFRYALARAHDSAFDMFARNFPAARLAKQTVTAEDEVDARRPSAAGTTFFQSASRLRSKYVRHAAKTVSETLTEPAQWVALGERGRVTSAELSDVLAEIAMQVVPAPAEAADADWLSLLGHA